MGVLPDPEDDSDDPKQKILIRMDSMEIEVHAKVMTRLEILYTSVVIVLRYFIKLDQDYLIPEALMHYSGKDDLTIPFITVHPRIIIAAETASNTTSSNELEEIFIDGLPDDGPKIELQTDGA